MRPRRRSTTLLADWTDVPSRFETQMRLFHDALEGKAPLPVTSARLAGGRWRSSRRSTTHRETREEVSFPVGPTHPKYGSWLPEEFR